MSSVVALCADDDRIPNVIYSLGMIKFIFNFVLYTAGSTLPETSMFSLSSLPQSFLSQVRHHPVMFHFSVSVPSSSMMRRLNGNINYQLGCIWSWSSRNTQPLPFILLSFYRSLLLPQLPPPSPPPLVSLSLSSLHYSLLYDICCRWQSVVVSSVSIRLTWLRRISDSMTAWKPQRRVSYKR